MSHAIAVRPTTALTAYNAYPHEAGYLFDCAACESACHCTADHAECVYSGEHNGSADA
jgi:hypothetical protein